MTKFLRGLMLFLTSTLLFAQVEPSDTIPEKEDSLLNQNITTDFSFGNVKEYLINDITLSGNTKYTVYQILKFIGLKKGDKITIPGLEIGQATQKLWNEKRFSDVAFYAETVSANAVNLRIHLEDLPQLKEAIFHGIKKTRQEEFIKDNGLDPNIRITENLINETKNSIKNYYIEKGKPDAKVIIKTIPVEDQPGKVFLDINIDQGDRVRIRDIEIIGNEAISDGVLKRKALKNTKVKNINFINKSSKVIKDDLKDDLKEVEKVYKSLGFRDAKVISDTVERVSDNRYEIRIYVDEGKKYYLGEVNFKGNSIYSTELLEEIFQYQKGDAYDAVGIDERINQSEKEDDIYSLYSNRGYLFANLIKVEKNVQNDTIDLDILIQEGEPAYIGKVAIEGNTVTHDHVIIRDLRTRPGDLFSRGAIKRTYFELAQSGFFEPTAIAPDVQPNPESNTVDVTWKLAHKSSSQVELQGGYGGGRFIGTLGLTFGNFSLKNIFKGDQWRPIPQGDGQQLSIRAQAGQNFQNYSLSFVEPWISGKKPTSLSVSFTNSIFTIPAGLFNDRQRLNIFGTSVSLSKLLSWPDDYFRISHTLAYQRYSFDNYQLRAGNLIFSDGNSNNLNYTLGITRNSAADPIFPTEGSEFSAQLTVTPPFSMLNNKDYGSLTDQEKFEWLEYYKINTRAYWYKELVGKLVLRAGGEFGYLGYYNNEVGSIPFERYYVGGIGLNQFAFDGRDIIPLRGYEDSSTSGGVAGRDITPEGGGVVYNKYLLELRYPIVMTQTKIYGLTFVEGANTFAKHNEFKPFELQRSAGLGIRIFMPAFGLLGFDFAYGYDNALFSNGVSGWQTHFIFNQQL